MTTSEKRAPNPTLAALRDLVRTCSNFRIHGYADPRRESYSDAWIFELTGTRKIKGAEVYCKTEIRGSVRNGHTNDREVDKAPPHSDYFRYTEAFRPVKGYWSLMWDDIRIRSAVMALPVDVEPTLEVYLDAGTNPLAIEAFLHVDHLYLRGKRETPKFQEWTFLLDAATTRHNTARFGSPRHDSDKVGREDW